MPKGVPSIPAMALGLVKDYTSGYGVICQQTYAQPELCATLNTWFNSTAPGFLYSSVQCNKAFGAALHVDGNNCGPSAIISMGDHSGGELWVWDEEGDCHIQATKSVSEWCKEGDWIRGTKLDIHDTLTIIDGCRPHCVMPYSGERYSLVFFVHNSGVLSRKSTESKLRELKFHAPDRRCLEMLQAGCGIYRPVLTEGPDGVLRAKIHIAAAS